MDARAPKNIATKLPLDGPAATDWVHAYGHDFVRVVHLRRITLLPFEAMTWRMAWIGFLLGSACCCSNTTENATAGARTTVAIDFGAAEDAGLWQVVSDPASPVVHELRTISGEASGIWLTISDDFADVNRFGCRQTAPELGLPASVSSDSFWGNASPFHGAVNPTGGVRLGGLEPGRAYAIDVYASRISDEAGRMTRYILGGDTAVLDAANNVGERVRFETSPGPDGTLTLSVTAASDNATEQQFFYLGAMVISWADDRSPRDGTLTWLAPSGGERWQAGAQVRLKWENTTGDSVALSLAQGSVVKPLANLPATANEWFWHIPEDTPPGEARIHAHAGPTAAVANPSGSFTVEADVQDIRPIVVIGSSTAAGAGASSPDSSWVGRYRWDLASRDTRFPVVNLAKGGYTTRHLKPVGEGVDSLRNITMALSLNPAAIVVNLPSNDAAQHMPFAETWANFQAMATAASKAHVPLWVATTQPRNGLDADQTQLQTRTRDSIVSVFGDRALDFWTGLATPTGEVLPDFDAGDGVHLTDAGHRLLYERVRAENLPTLTSPHEPPTGVVVTVEDSIRVRRQVSGPVDYRWVSAEGKLILHGRAEGTEFAIERDSVLLDAVRTLHLSGGGGVWRVWNLAKSAARPRRSEDADR
jgi:lysophospholipase L1-like esterase